MHKQSRLSTKPRAGEPRIVVFQVWKLSFLLTQVLAPVNFG